MAVYVCLLMERVTGNFRLQEVATSSLIVSGSLVRVPCVNLLGSVCGYLSPRNLVARYMADLGGVARGGWEHRTSERTSDLTKTA